MGVGTAVTILLSLTTLCGTGAPQEMQADAKKYLRHDVPPSPLHYPNAPVDGINRCSTSPGHCHCHWHHASGSSGEFSLDKGPAVKTRRYDIADLGYSIFFHGWADVQGQGAANDYCRIVGASSLLRLACALAGTHGQGEIAYESAWDFPIGHTNTWYMKDEDGDGRDDYCRCLGEDPNKSQVVCTKAGKRGFHGSKLEGGTTKTFTPTGNIDCKMRTVFPEFGRVGGFVQA